MRTVWMLPVLAAAALGQEGRPVIREGHLWTQTTSGTALVPAGRLKVSAGGDITVRGTEDGNISYTLKKRASVARAADAERLLRELVVVTKRLGQTTWLYVKQPGRDSVSSDLELRVPRRLLQSSFLSYGGTIEAYGLNGAVEVRTTGGRVRLDGIDGDAVIRTGGGEVRLGRIGGSLRCVSGGGNIYADSVGGQAYVETGGGEIVVGEAGGPVNASTAGGCIRVDRVASLRAATASGNILAKLLAGAALANSNLSTESGDVTVLIPSNLAVTVQARTQGSGRPSRIVSDFAEIQASLARDARPAVAEGSLNGGGPLLQISANRGTIYIRRQR